MSASTKTTRASQHRATGDGRENAELDCPVAPLAREYAAIVRARRALDKTAEEPTPEGKALLALTACEAIGPMDAEYADKLLCARYDGIERRARNLIATSRIGLAFQLLLVHTDDLKNRLPSAHYDGASKQLREVSETMDSERGPIIWATYRYLTRGWQDRDLEALESILGRECPTDIECVTRILAAA